MRNALSEIPVFAFCLWGGMLAGLSVSLLRLPLRLYLRSLKGRRAAVFPVILFGFIEVLAAAAAAFAFCLTMLRANGGELRLFAFCAFLTGAALPARAAWLIISDD